MEQVLAAAETWRECGALEAKEAKQLMDVRAGIRGPGLETGGGQCRHKRQTVEAVRRKDGGEDGEKAKDSDKTAVVVVVDGRNDEGEEIMSGNFILQILNIDGGNSQTDIKV